MRGLTPLVAIKTRLPARESASASTALSVDLPEPPLPVTNRKRCRRRGTIRWAADAGANSVVHVPPRRGGQMRFEFGWSVHVLMAALAVWGCKSKTEAPPAAAAVSAS